MSWISVKERLPEPKQVVVAHCENDGFTQKMRYDPTNDILEAEWFVADVTHWMPLPQKEAK